MVRLIAKNTMPSALICLVLCALGQIELGSSMSLYDRRRQHQFQIINGNESDPHIKPEIVYIEILKRNKTSGTLKYFDCGGTILSANYVLTAAHCVYDSISVDILAGAHNRKKYEPQFQIISVKRKHVHEKYVPDRNINDIATLELETPIDFSLDYVGRVSFPRRADASKIYVGELATAFGWGVIDDTGATSDVLRQIEYPVISLQDCLSMLAAYNINRIPKKDMCAADPVKSTCVGDSGGPLYIGDVQIGVTSFGVRESKGCALGAPNVYVKVDNYFDWIEKHSDIKIS